jgi:L-rhamnose mutarotase
MTQEEKLSARLKQVLSETGLHEIKVYINAEKEVVFWVVETKKAEGEKSSV